MATPALTDQHRAILDLEGQWWATPGGKDTAIAKLGLSPVRYYQLLNQLVRTESALAYSPVVVNRLRRVSRRGRASSTHG